MPITPYKDNLFLFFFLEQPEEMSQIRELEEQVETLKTETRNRLLQNIDKKYGELGNLRSLHEREIETMTRQIDLLQEQLEETMKSRYKSTFKIKTSRAYSFVCWILTA